MVSFRAAAAAGLALGSAVVQGAFNLNGNQNMVAYWGQNSYGASHGSDTANWQKPLATYCDDDTYDVLILSFVTVFFSTGGAPEINMANSCNPTDNGTFPGTSLATCQSMASDIKTCQSKGKVVTIALGGASGAYGFSSDDQARTFADTVWNVFLGGSSDTRPFGDAVLDGIDLDIEGGASTGYSAFVEQLKTHTNGASKKYYYSAAPQCPYPDAYTQTVLNEESFDFVNIQFYNNYCGVYAYNTSNWNYADWENWADTVSPNKQVRLMVGAMASPTAGNNAQYYVDAATLGGIGQDLQGSSDNFGGIMLWDVSQAEANGHYAAAVKAYLTGNAKSSIRPKSHENLRDTHDTQAVLQDKRAPRLWAAWR